MTHLLPPAWVYLGGTTLETTSEFPCKGQAGFTLRTQGTGTTWPNHFKADKSKNCGWSQIATDTRSQIATATPLSSFGYRKTRKHREAY